MAIDMSFLSPEFAFLFSVFLIFYWSCRSWPSVQNNMILVVGYLILASMSTYFFIVLFLYTFVIYFFGLLISSNRRHGRIWLLFSLVFSICNLAVFKYFDFLRDSINQGLSGFGFGQMIPAWQIIAPLGLSFYTFHSISYLVSLQKGEQQQVRFTDFALFLSFFPSVIAGPINRAVDFMPQINSGSLRFPNEYPKAFILIVFSIIKVVWLSAFLSNTWVHPVFSDPGAFHMLDLWLGLMAYAWQIYLNFSGYTDLVTGLALLMGFRLPVNFRAPYTANNLRCFWQRWHITLSQWIRDYIYIPLGGSRQGFTRTQINLMIALALSGIWHGAGANFLIWGCIHGVGLVLLNAGDRIFGAERLSRFSPVLANLATFLYVSIGWIFFRAQDSEQGFYFLHCMFENTDIPLVFNSPWYILLMLLFLQVYPWVSGSKKWIIENFHRLPWPLMPPVLVSLAWFGLMMAPAGIPAFIYASF